MAAQQPASIATFSHDERQIGPSSNNRSSPSTALLIEYYEGVANKGSNMPSVRVKVNPYMGDNQQQQTERTSYVSPLPTRENTVIHHQHRTEADEGREYEPRQADTNTTTQGAYDPSRGRQRSRAVPGQLIHDEEEEPLPAQPYRSIDRRDISDPQSLLPMSSVSNDIVSSRQFQAIIASAIQELILPEIQAVRNELSAQAQLFHHQPGLNQVSNQATFGTSTSGRKRSRSLTALDAPLHRRNSTSIGTAEGYQGEVLPLPPRPTSPNVPAAMEAESLLRADLRSELKITPPGTAHRERAPASHRLSGLTDGPAVVDPSSHTVFNLAEGAYKKRESHEERMAAAKARRAEERRLLGESLDEDIPEDQGDLEDQVPERTRFSMLTAERGESSIHEFINDEMESTPMGRSAQDSRDKDIVLIKAQLDTILEHLKSSAADRSGRETDILSQVSVLAENTHRSLQQLKDTILEETNVTVGALSYNIERYVGRMVQGPRPYPGKTNKGLGKSASYPQDNRTLEQTAPIRGPIRRTTTFFQELGQALTPSPGRSAREKREGMERLEAMMQRVLEEVEMLKRMKQGARRKTNGEMFKGEARSRLSPPEDAITYIDEVRGDAANRERGESDEERMARIERSANAFEEEEKTKRSLMQNAIATETSIIRQSSKDVRLAKQPLAEGFEPLTMPRPEDSEYEPGPSQPRTGPRLPPLEINDVGNLQYVPARETTVDPIINQTSSAPSVDEQGHSPSNESYVHGDEGRFTIGGRNVTVHTETPESKRAKETNRKISIKEPVMLGSSDDAVQSGSGRESGVLGEHLEDKLGHEQTQAWMDHTEHVSMELPSQNRNDATREVGNLDNRQLPITTSQNAEVEDFDPQFIPQRQRSQYFVIDQFGRRQYYLGDPKAASMSPGERGQNTPEWSRKVISITGTLSPTKNNDKGKETEAIDKQSVVQQLLGKPIPDNARETTVPPLPSLFAPIEQPLEASPSNRLKKKTFRKPITTPFGIPESPITAPQRLALERETDLPNDVMPLDSTPEKKKKRRSWRDALGLSSNKTTQNSPRQPAKKEQTVEDKITLTYPGPKNDVQGKNGFNYVLNLDESDDDDDDDDDDKVVGTGSTQPQPSPSPRAYRDSISDSVKEDAMINMQLSDELASGRHPASIEVPADVQFALRQHAKQGERQKQDKPRTSPEPPGPYARRRERDFTPTPPIRDPLPASHLIPDGLFPPSTYSPTEPLTPSKTQTMARSRASPSPPRDDSLYNAAAIRQTFSNNLTRRPTPPRAPLPASRTPRAPSKLAEVRDIKPPTTLKHERDSLTNADFPTSNGQISPTKTDSSYKTAHDGQYVRSDDGVRPPSLYSHDSIGGDKFSRNRARTPPDAYSVSSADFSSSTRPLDPAAPAKYQYKTGSSPPRHAPRDAHLSKPNRVPSGPRVAPPNFSNMKTVNREDRYSRPSFTASDYTRPTSEETDELTAVVGNAVRTDIRNRSGTISPNWVRTRRVQGEVKG